MPDSEKCRFWPKGHGEFRAGDFVEYCYAKRKSRLAWVVAADSESVPKNCVPICPANSDYKKRPLIVPAKKLKLAAPVPF